MFIYYYERIINKYPYKQGTSKGLLVQDIQLALGLNESINIGKKSYLLNKREHEMYLS